MASVDKKSSSRTRFILTVAIAVVVAGIAAATILWATTSPKKAAASTNLCTAWTNVTNYTKAHPPKHTYPDLKSTLTYSYDALNAVSSAPPVIATDLGQAVSSSQAMIAVIDKIMAKVNLSSAQKSASLTEIKLWASSTQAIATWSKNHC